jgi:hypothetical protein
VTAPDEPDQPDIKPAVPDPGRVRRAGRRVAHAAVTARDTSVAALVTAVTPVVRAVGVLLLLVLGLIILPAVLLLVAAWWRPGPGDWFWTVLAAIGLAVAGWLLHRRRQLLATVADRDRLIAGLTRVLQGRDLADRLTANLTRTGVKTAGRAAIRRGSRGVRVLRGMWHGIQLTGIVDELLAADEIAPLTPGRIRGIVILTVVAAISAAVLWVCLGVATLALLLGA